jgi:branched-chain amino acid transport system ATP-binding protein
MRVLEIRDLSVFYGSFQALWGVALDVERGQIVSILGSNGAGKSTLLMAISGLLRVASGAIRFEEKRIDGLEPHQIVDLGIALVPEGRKIFLSLTVRENLLIGSFTPRARGSRIDNLEYIYRLFPPLKARASQKGTNLSGGEQQMLAIGRALMSTPRFIVFDEISLGLSPLVVKELYRTVKEINQKGLTTVLVEQDVKRSLKVADYAYILQEGKVMLRGNPRYFSEDVVKKAYFGL